MRFKFVLGLCATMVVLSATANAGWWHRHHRCPHCSGYGASTAGVASSGGEFASASGEAYVVRTAPERVRYYAVSERLLADPLDFRSARSTEEVAREAARAELGRIEDEKARIREAAREAITERFESGRGPGAEASREADITTIVQGISMVFELLDRLRIARGGGTIGGGEDPADCEAKLAELRQQVRELQRNQGRRPAEEGSNNGSDRRGRPSFNPGRENSTGGAGEDAYANGSTEAIKKRAEQLSAQRAERVQQLEKELEILKSITISVQPQPRPEQPQ